MKSDIHPENIWLPIAGAMITAIGAGIFAACVSRKDYTEPEPEPLGMYQGDNQPRDTWGKIHDAEMDAKVRQQTDNYVRRMEEERRRESEKTKQP